MQIDKSNELQHSGIIGKAKDWVKSNVTGKAAVEGAAESSLLSEVDDYSGSSSKKMPGIGTCTKIGATLGGAVGGAGGMLGGYADLKANGQPEIKPGPAIDILDPKLVGQLDTVSPSGGGYRHKITPVIVEEKVGTYTKSEVTYKRDDPFFQGLVGLVGGTVVGGVIGLVTGVILKIVGGRGEKGAEQKVPDENKDVEKKGRSVGGTLGVVGGAVAGAAGGLYLAEKTIAVKDAYAPDIFYQSPVYKPEVIGYTNMDHTSNDPKPFPSAPASEIEMGPPGDPGSPNLKIYAKVPQRNPDGSLKFEQLWEKPTGGFDNPLFDRVLLTGLGGLAGAMGAIAIKTIIRVVTGGEKA